MAATKMKGASMGYKTPMEMAVSTLGSLIPNELSAHDFARLCLVITRRPEQIDAALAQPKDVAGERILILLNDASFAQQSGFTTFFPSIDPERLVRSVTELRKFQAFLLKQAIPDLFAESLRGVINFPPDLFELLFSEFKPLPGEKILIPCVENALAVALNLTTKFPQCEFSLWFEMPDTLGIMSFLFGDLRNVTFENVATRGMEGSFAGYQYVIALPPFGARLPREVASGWKRNLSAAQRKSLSHIKPRADADLFIHRMLTESFDRSQFIVLVPELFMHSHGSFEELRNLLSGNRQLKKVISLSEKVFEPHTKARLSLLYFTNYQLPADSEVEVLKVEAAGSRLAKGPSQPRYFVEERKLVSAKTLRDSNVWNLEAIFAEKPAAISPQIETVPMKELIKEIFRGPTTVSPGAGLYARTETLRVVGLTEMEGIVTNVDSIEPTEVTLNTPPARYFLQDGDIVVTCRSTKIKLSLVQISADIQAIPSNNVAVIRAKKDAADPYFLHCFLTTDVGREAIEARLSGTSQKKLSVRDLETIEIPATLLDEQQKIGQKYKELNIWHETERRKLDEKYQEELGSLSRMMGLETAK